MLYRPERFVASDALLEEIVRDFPFATLITGDQVSHVPLVLEKRGAEWVLLGHFARANPHGSILSSRDSLAIFHGPHAYITPTWYAAEDVPTWNYVVAHLRGVARLIEDEAGIEKTLRSLAQKMDPDWAFAIPADLAEPGTLAQAIVGFEIAVHTRQGKLKLSQNRDEADYAGVLRGLATRKDEASQGVRSWMKRIST